jgi:hypothetical protein
MLFGEINPAKSFNVSNKLINSSRLLLVTGSLNLYGKYISNPISFLQRSEKPGAAYIKMDNKYDSHSLMIVGSSDPPYSNFEYVYFEELLNSGEVRIIPPLSNFHFGSALPAEKELRTVIAAIERNIIIEEEPYDGKSSTDSSFSIIIHYELNTTEVAPNEFNSVFDNVMITNCNGKCLQINGGRVRITGSSIGKGGIEINGGEKVKLQGNIFYDCEGTMLKVYETDYFFLDNNAMIGKNLFFKKKISLQYD